MFQIVSFVLTGLRTFSGRFAGERGQDLIEYAVLSGVIAAAIVAVGAAALTGALNDMVDGISRCIDFDAGTTCDV
jgi:Flp pilus assembly pilin Flp